MAQELEVLKEAVKHVGYFKYSELYAFCYNWLKDNGYDVKETEYTEKLSNDGKEVEIKWEAVKDVTDYFQNKIELKWHILRMQDAEVEIEGKKKKTNKGEVKLTFTISLVKDYEKRWEQNPFYKFLRGVYDKYIIRTTIDQYKDRLKDKADSFIEDTKAFIRLEGKK